MLFKQPNDAGMEKGATAQTAIFCTLGKRSQELMSTELVGKTMEAAMRWKEKNGLAKAAMRRDTDMKRRIRERTSMKETAEIEARTTKIKMAVEQIGRMATEIRKIRAMKTGNTRPDLKTD